MNLDELIRLMASNYVNKHRTLLSDYDIPISTLQELEEERLGFYYGYMDEIKFSWRIEELIKIFWNEFQEQQ